MKQIIFLLLVIVLGNSISAFAQKTIAPPQTVCPASYTYNDFHVGPPAKYLKTMSNGKLSSVVKTSNFVVTYHGFEGFTEAKDAFQFAVDIWATLIKSDVTIYIDATYKVLGTGVLGSAGTTRLYKGFDGAPNDSTFYNVALAEKIAGKDLNEPGEADISASFASTFDWYLGTDGEPGNKYDFASIVLHEIGHGLGFFAIDNYKASDKTATRNSGAYDVYIEDGNGVKIFNIPSGTTELGSFLTSNNLFLNAPLATISNGGSPPKIYAPNPYNGGSSISHWDDATFDGTADALMTHAAAPGESIHNPGNNALSLFANLGWVHTYMKHEPKLFIDNLVDDIAINLQVASDTTLSSEAPKVHYSYDNFSSQTDVLMNADGNGLYSLSITNPGAEAKLLYYITGVSDVLGRDYTSPTVTTDRHSVFIRDASSTAVPYSLADGGDFESISNFTQVSFKGNVSIWEQGVPENNLNTPSSGTQVWKTDLDADLLKPASDYSTALISPKYDLSDTTADYNIKFDLSMDVSSDTAIAGLNVMYSLDRGINWQDLGAPNDGKGSNWMNKTGVFNLFESGNAFVLNNTAIAPQSVSHSLSDIIGDGESEIYFALVASVTNNFIDGVYVFDGMMIDNFEITKTTPKAFFSVVQSGVVFPGNEVQFHYNSRGAESFNWNFGDGETSQAKNPKHVYQNGGTYEVELQITYPGGNDTYAITEAVRVITSKSSTYTLTDGGDMETNFNDFLIENIAGTPFESGESSITGKNGTASGTKAWVSGINASTYENNSLAYIYTPIFDFSIIGNYQLSFKANYSFEDGWDGFILESSIDNGTNWKQVNPNVADGWYDKIGDDNPAQGWPAIPLFTGTTNGDFVTKTVDVTELNGNGGVVFRIKFLTDAAEVDAGMAFDDFELTGPALGPVVPDFTFEGMSGCDGQVVTFTSTSTGSITSYNWDFGANATPSDTTGLGPFEVTYVGSGTSTVILSVGGVDNVTEVKLVINAISTGANHIPTFAEEAVPGNDAQLNLVASSGDSYQWFKNGVEIDAEVNQSYMATETASYAVEVVVDGCLGRSEDSRLVTALNDQYFNNSVLVYPNPAESKIYIDFTNEYKGKVYVKLIGVDGKSYFEKTLLKNDFSISKEVEVSTINRGIYFVELIFGDQKEVRKIIIK